MRISNDPIPAQPAIESVFEFVNESLQHPNVTYSLSMPHDREWMIGLSSTALSQVMLNLLGNAMQALESRGYGHVAVSCREELHNGDQASLVVDVCDDGPGVPSELQATLFEPFVSGHTTIGRSGMGLAISRQIMNEAGGALTLEPSSSGALRIEIPLAGPRFAFPLARCVIEEIG